MLGRLVGGHNGTLFSVFLGISQSGWAGAAPDSGFGLGSHLCCGRPARETLLEENVSRRCYYLVAEFLGAGSSLSLITRQGAATL